MAPLSKKRTGEFIKSGIFAIVISAVMAAPGPRSQTPPEPVEEPAMPKYKEYLGKLIGLRPGWPDDMTPDEEKVMSRHFIYLKDLVDKKKVLMAGPCFGDKFGLVVLRTADENEANAIMKNDPSVMAGLHRYELHEMAVSLMAHNLPPDRLPKLFSKRDLRKDIIVPASRDQVWAAWTTSEGLKSFFSPAAEIELRVGGKFEIQFLLEAPYGQRGSEDCFILSYLPPEMLSFEWNAPPTFGKLRDKRTHVVLHFREIEPGKTSVELAHLGWGEGEEWDKLFEYFDRAWDTVLANLRKRFIDGPLE